jgi:ribosome biogenesis GTPase / thiamine phosphate phosphatase
MVVEYHREWCWVALRDGREVIAKPRARLELADQPYARQLTVGDQVVVEEAAPEHLVIEQIKPRETWLLRKNLMSYRNRPQCIVANADQLAVVVAPRPELNLNIVDRYFLAAIMGGLAPILIVNKIDVDPKVEQSLEIATYVGLGYPVFFTAATSSHGIDALRPALAGKLTAFCGHSGVGKSTLLRELTGRDDITVGHVNELTQKGRQTTVTSRIYELETGGQVLDTPGVKEFGLHELDWTEVQEYFADINTLAQGCGYRDCMHRGEPNCKVREAIVAKTLSPARLESYQRLRDEAREQERAF